MNDYRGFAPGTGGAEIEGNTEAEIFALELAPALRDYFEAVIVREGNRISLSFPGGGGFVITVETA